MSKVSRWGTAASTPATATTQLSYRVQAALPEPGPGSWSQVTARVHGDREPPGLPDRFDEQDKAQRSPFTCLASQ